MELSNDELKRIYESMKWIKDKGNIEDPVSLSAFEKICVLNEKEVERYNICVVSKKNPRGKGYRDLSLDAMSFIDRRIEEGYKNTYHSVMSIFGNHLRKLDNGESIEERKAKLKESYIQKYKIKEEDLACFNEIFETAYESAMRKISSGSWRDLSGQQLANDNLQK